MIQKNLGKYSLYILAIGLFVWAGLWLRTGFYMSQLPFIAVIFAASVVAAFVAQKMPTKR